MEGKAVRPTVYTMVLHALEFNLFYHIKNDKNIFRILDLVLTH